MRALPEGRPVENHPREIDVGELLENRRLGRFQWLTLILGCLILFVDGLDFSAANVGAPAILRALNAQKSAMGIVFGAGFVGILVGSLIFGYIGDRFGRKTGAILGVLAYSVPALLTVFATSLDQLATYRFLSGLGIGGVVPNVIALLTETAPKRYRNQFRHGRLCRVFALAMPRLPRSPRGSFLRRVGRLCSWSRAWPAWD